MLAIQQLAALAVGPGMPTSRPHGAGSQHDAGVTELVRDDLEVGARGQGIAGRAVPKIMQPHRRQAQPAHTRRNSRVGHGGDTGPPTVVVNTYPPTPRRRASASRAGQRVRSTAIVILSSRTVR
jgi:hypothetical protein